MRKNKKKNRIKNDDVRYQKGLMSTLHKELSYDELVKKSIGLTEGFIPPLPVKVWELIVSTQIEYRTVAFFLDIQSVKSLRYIGSDMSLIPVTADLLDLYGVSPNQFVDDFFSMECAAFTIK